MEGIAVFHVFGVTAAVLLGLGGLIRGFQMGRGRFDLISDWDNLPLPRPAELATAFSRVYTRLGGAILLSPIALLLGLPLLVWGVVVGVLVWYWFEAIERIVVNARAEASNE